ncbi:MAG: hypothetical protein ACP5PS_10765 [Bacteroidales bacterium]
MERKSYIFIAMYICLQVSILAQTTPESNIYRAYISGNMNEWKNQMNAYQATTQEQKLALINYHYGYIAYCIGNKKKSEAEQYLTKAEKLLSVLEKVQYKLSLVYAYKSAFTGFHIGISPHKAPFLGKQSLDYAQKSLSIDKNNYFAYLQLGNIAFYTPAMFGGSKTEALKHYLKALELMEKNANSLIGNWNYLNLLVTIINAFYEVGQYETAKRYCEKTLAIEPQFDWVKNHVYPKVLKKLKNE